MEMETRHPRFLLYDPDCSDNEMTPFLENCLKYRQSSKVGHNAANPTGRKCTRVARPVAERMGVGDLIWWAIAILEDNTRQWLSRITVVEGKGIRR
jgi:hypothetical protein